MRDVNHDSERYHCINLVHGRALSFHVSLLRHSMSDSSLDALTSFQVAMRDTDENIVDCIVDHKIIPGGHIRKRTTIQFRVRWLGYDPTEDTWEPYRDVRDL